MALTPWELIESEVGSDVQAPKFPIRYIEKKGASRQRSGKGAIRKRFTIGEVEAFDYFEIYDHICTNNFELIEMNYILRSFTNA